MTDAHHPPTTPGRPDADARHGLDPAPSLIGSPSRLLACCAASLGVMAPWPLLGALLLHAQLDRASEAFLFLGGVTMFPLMILALFGDVSEALIVKVLEIVWLAVALAPAFLLRRRLVSRTRLGVLLCVQSLFALAQAAMGALLIIGKSV